MSRTAVLTDAQWARIRPLLVSSAGRSGLPFRDDRQVVEGIIYRYRCSFASRDAPRALGIGCWHYCWPRTIAGTWSIGRCRWTRRSTGRTSTPPTCPGSQGDLSNCTNLRVELPDHAIGRSRGGVSTKVYALTDGKGRPLVVLVAPGQGGDSPMFPLLMNQLRVERVGVGRA